MPRHYTPKVAKACDRCGKVTLYRPCEVKRFCSHACYADSRKGIFTAPHETRICPICDKSFEDLVSQIGVYCSRDCADKAKVQDIATRFWTKVDKSGECWFWSAGVGTDGYAKFWYNGTSTHASRAAYELTFGPIPDGLQVCHHCDTPRCVRPEHLFLGTNFDNAQDMVEKHRSAIGVRHPNAKLTEQSVIEIRRRYDAGIRISELMQSFGLSHGGIYAVVHHVTWRHI